MLGITYLFDNELVHLRYIAVTTNANSLRPEVEEPFLITEANTIVELYPYPIY